MGKTITTYLVDGDPKGTRYCFLSNKLCQMFVIPRSNLSYLTTQEKLHKPAFYILLGEDEDDNPKAYIGETENFTERVKSHDSNKGFWQKALVFISSDSTMTKADVQYLEYKAIAKALELNHYVLNENKQIPSKPNLPEYQESTMNDFFEDVKILTSFIECNIFEEIINPIKKAKETEELTEDLKKEIFYLKSKRYNASGIYTSSGFVILKGSVISQDTRPSYEKHFSKLAENRKKLIQENTILINNELILQKDLTFKSPSGASDFVEGGPSNGWGDWKNDKGQDLNSIYRLK